MKIFTKRFFRLTSTDQAAVVHAVLHDLENCIGQLPIPRINEELGRGSSEFRRRANTHRVFSV